MSAYQPLPTNKPTSLLQGWVSYSLSMKTILLPPAILLGGLTVVGLFRADTPTEAILRIVLLAGAFGLAALIAFLISHTRYKVKANLSENNLSIKGEVYPLSYLQSVEVTARNHASAKPLYKLKFNVKDNESNVAITINQGVAMSKEKLQHLMETINRSGIPQDQMQEIESSNKVMKHKLGKAQLTQLISTYAYPQTV